MLNNLVNLHDLSLLAEKIRCGQLGQILRVLLSPKQNRIKETWKDAELPPTDWLSIPIVNRRWNYLVSGDINVDYYEYMSQKCLSSATPITALSLGCGSGDRELMWAKLGKFRRIDAYDLSEVRIAYAKKRAAETGYGHIVNYQVGNVFPIDLPHASYDLLLAEHSLHHFSPLGTLLPKLSSSLKPEGHFIVNEFIGPDRFQWTARQLEVVNFLLSLLPVKYRIRWNSGLVKSKVFRPSRLSMILRDPSEAVESSRILPLLTQIFDVVEIKECGGTILHLLLADIAHNFLSEEEETNRFLNLFLEVEDLILEAGDLPSDFVVAVCKKR